MGLYPVKSEYRDYTFPTDHYENRIYHVSDQFGNDNFSGLSWKKAKKTIMAAVNLARYEVGGTTINSDSELKTLVLVAPGLYNERVAWSGYGVDLVGLGHGRPGKAHGVCVNYDGALDAGDGYIVAFGGSGNSVRNLYVNVEEALPGIRILNGDNNLIENCVIEAPVTNMTYGIHAQSMKGSVIRDCVITGFDTAGIWVEGGGDVFAIQGGIHDNVIWTSETGADGILVDVDVTAYAFVIKDNHIDVLGGGAGSLGMDINYTGIIFVTDNFVRAHTTAIDSEGEGCINNHCSVGAAGAAAYALIDEGDM